MYITPPNYTQIPNDLLDNWLPMLGCAELKVLMVIMRKTFGWHKIRDQISLGQLETITGLERKHVSKAVKDLLKKGLILKTVVGENGTQVTIYELVVSDDSNNSYQCPKDTPTSVLKTPTKETVSKEIKESSLKRAKEKSASPPPPLFESHFKDKFENRIQVSSENFKRLLEKFKDEKLINDYAERLYRWSFNNEKEFKKKKRHDMVIEDWIEKDIQKQKPFKADESKLNDLQKHNWEANQDIVNELKTELPHKAGGLHFYYKAYILKDRNNREFDLFGLMDHKDFCRQLQKHLKINIMSVRFPNE